MSEYRSSVATILVQAAVCWLLLLPTGAVDREAVTLQVGERRDFSLRDGTASFLYRFNKTEEGLSPALRLTISSDNASSVHPLLVTARQSQGISSWTLPYIESGFSFSSVERTLCPLLNLDPDAKSKEQLQVILEVSTSSPEVVTLTASPSSPAYLLFEHPPEHSRVRVRFSSKDATRGVCAIASIQKSYCPVVDLLDNPDHRGTYQTMRSQAAINIQLVNITNDTETITDKQQTQFNFFYIVVSVFPSNDTCQTMGVTGATRLVTLEVDDNFNPQPFLRAELTKNINITVEPAFSGSGYAVGFVVPFILYFLFYGIALLWIFFADWFRYWTHPQDGLIEDLKRMIRAQDEGEAVELPDPNGVGPQDLNPAISPSDPTTASSGPLEMVPESGLPNPTTEDGLPNPEFALTPATLELARQSSKLHPPEDSFGLESRPSESSSPDANKNRKPSSSPTPQPPPSSPTHLLASSPSHLGSPEDQPDGGGGGGGGGGVGASFRKSFASLFRSQRDRIGDSLRATSQERISTKRPSLLSVLTGNQYDEALSQVTTPSPHYPQYLHSSSSLSKSHRRSTSHHHTHSIKSPTSSSSITSAAGHTPRSQESRTLSSAMAASPQGRKVTRSISLGTPYKRPRLQGSISLTSPVVDQVSNISQGQARRVRRSSERMRHPQIGVDSPDFFEEQVSSRIEEEQGEELQEVRARRASYYKATEEDGEGVWYTEEGEVRVGIEEEEEEKYRHDEGKFPVNLCMSELPEFDETARVQKKYNLLSWYLVAVIIFYAIPAYQLVITYQQLLTLSGNEDLCYYNSLCSHPLRLNNRLTLSAFNNICSNMGYFILGGLFILITWRRRRVYHAIEALNNPFRTTPETRHGVPQHFGIYYAIGLALIAEGFMSVAYHVCPGKTNYQFDTTFMFVLAGLGIFKLMESRSPDKHPGFHKILVLSAVMIVMVVVGVLAASVYFYIAFLVVHVLATFFFTVQYYYRWQLQLSTLHPFLKYITTTPLCPPKQIPKFIFVVVANGLNWILMDFQPIKDIAFQLPQFTMANMTAYFIERLAGDGKSANDFKNANKKSFPLFQQGHVQSITACFDSDTCTYKCICLPEMRKNVTYKIMLTVNLTSGDIKSATCGCPAGLRPAGSCKHIGALCYALEEFSRIKTTNDYVACTSKLQEWNKPRKRKLDTEKSTEIKFVKLEHSKIKRESILPCYDPRPVNLQKTTSQEIDKFREDLCDLKRPCAFLHVLQDPHVPSLPVAPLLPIPRSSREKVLVEMQSMEHPLSLYQIAGLGQHFLSRITPGPSSRDRIEATTKAQSHSKRWHEEHFERLTSSRFGEVIKRRVPTNKCADLLYPSKSSLSSAAIMWGNENECKARDQYAVQNQKNIIRESGIHISELGYLAASPDGLVYDTDENLLGIIEIKCPYSARNITVSDACSQSTFFCTKDSEDNVCLRKKHNYYYQIQGQLAILKVDWCDFIIWTLKDFNVERIYFDSEFWSTKCLPSLRSFYYNIMLPELVYPCHPQSPHNYSTSSLLTLTTPHFHTTTPM